MPNPIPGRWARLRRALQTIGLVAGGLLLGQQVLSAVQAVLLSEVHLQSPRFLVAAIGMSTLAGGVQLVGWLLIMRQLGAQLSWRQAARGYNLSFLPRYIPGSVWGYLSRSEWLLRNHAISYSVSNIGSILEVNFILLAGAAFSLAYGLPLLLGMNPIIAFGGAGLMLLAAYLALRYLPGWLSRSTGRFAVILAEVPRVGPARFAGLLAVYIGLWLCHGLMLFCLTQSLGYTNASALLHYVLIYYLAWTGGFLVLFVPAGFGVRDTLLSRLLSTVVGLLAPQAVVIAILARLSGLAGEIIWLGVSLTLAKPVGSSAKIDTNTD